MMDALLRSDELIAFLKSKRWFGDRTREVRDATFRDVIPVQWPGSDTPFAVARVEVATDSGTFTYQLFIERGVEQAADALDDAEFRRGLIDACARGMAFGAPGVRWILAPEGRRPLVVPPTAKVTRAKAEQSNSSIIVEGHAILKLFRKLEPGVNPDVEVTRFLTIDRKFAHVPALLGTITFEDAAGVTHAGMMQELVPGAVDAWTHALNRSREYFASKHAVEPPPFRDEAEQLGTVTRGLHEALASGEAGSDFAAHPVSGAELRAWVAQTTQMASRALTSLEKALLARQLPREHVLDAERIVSRRATYAPMVSGWAEQLGGDLGARARIHGDYHLGQVIRSGTGRFLIIDFEGEPARPLSERRAPHSPLRDVAGMLRSFAYAAAVGAQTASAGDRAARWEQATRAAFVRGYFQSAEGGPGLLPRSRDNAQRLMALFEAEKVFYELQYELDHRPDWAWIPLRGIGELNP